MGWLNPPARFERFFLIFQDCRTKQKKPGCCFQMQAYTIFKEA